MTHSLVKLNIIMMEEEIGDGYNCNASNVVSNISQSVALAGILYYEEEVLLMHFTSLLCINSSINSNSALIQPDILLISESGVESAIRRSHSDWLCSIYTTVMETLTGLRVYLHPPLVLSSLDSPTA